MKPIDYLKALGAAVAVLAANLLLLVVIVFAYSQAFARGHPPEFYNQLAMDLGTWSAPIGGFLLMFIANYLLGRRRPERNALVFAVAVYVAYLLIDVASGLAMAPASEFLNLTFLVSQALTALGALAGGWFAQRRNRS